MTNNRQTKKYKWIIIYICLNINDYVILNWMPHNVKQSFIFFSILKKTLLLDIAINQENEVNFMPDLSVITAWNEFLWPSSKDISYPQSHADSCWPCSELWRKWPLTSQLFPGITNERVKSFWSKVKWWTLLQFCLIREQQRQEDWRRSRITLKLGYFFKSTQL